MYTEDRNNIYLRLYKIEKIFVFIFILGFAANELAIRINHAKPKVIIAASCGIEPSKIVRYNFLSFFFKFAYYISIL